MKVELTKAEIARFHSKVRRGPRCWLWIGPQQRMGYGVFEVYRHGGRVRLLAHRAAFELATGLDPVGQVIRHDCDTPLCVRPDHLRPGTQRDNIHDAIRRGRANFSGLRVPRRQRKKVFLARMAEGVKRCAGCREVKSFDEYHRNRTAIDGRQPYCKSCRVPMEAARWANRPKRPPVPCGTVTAYRRHLRNGEPTCEPCRTANRIDTYKRRGITLETPRIGIDRPYRTGGAA